MILIKNKIDSVAPEILTTKGAVKTETYKTDFNNGSTEFDFDSTIYGHETVKQRLIQLQSYKCCFCEAHIGHTSYGDVEHFRPKAGWVQEEEAINKPGYYWLAYDWDNLLLSCQKCNQRYKKNYFPLAHRDNRALNHNEDIATEQPMFVHPAKENENPELHIGFNENETVALTERGQITITKLGLDRDLLNEDRRKDLKKVKVIYKLAKGIPDTNEELKNEAREDILQIYNDAQNDDTEYASMLRCFFKKYPVNF